MKRALLILLFTFILTHVGYIIGTELSEARRLEEIKNLTARLIEAKRMDEPYIAGRLLSLLFSTKLRSQSTGSQWQSNQRVMKVLTRELTYIIQISLASVPVTDVTLSENLRLVSACKGNQKPIDPIPAVHLLADRYDIEFESLLKVYHQATFSHNRAVSRNMDLLEKLDWNNILKTLFQFLMINWKINGTCASWLLPETVS